MASRESIQSAIRQRNVSGLLTLMIDSTSGAPRTGYRTETDLWDYKSECPPPARDAEAAWSDLAVDVLAFHNTQGGVIFFGITDDFKFCGARNRFDSKMFNDRLRKYLPDAIWVEFYRELIQDDQRYLGICVVPPRGPLPLAFRKEAPLKNGQRRFVEGDSAKRSGDSSFVIPSTEYHDWVRNLQVPVISGRYQVDEPGYRILQPDYANFVERTELGRQVERALRDPRTSVTSLIGLGGMGKTALATWAVLRGFDAGIFDFIVSLTAKDRELTSTGLLGLEPSLSTFEDLVDSIAEVLGFPDLKQQPLPERESDVRLLLESGKGLLFVDNLETVDDARVIQFLDTLPLGCRAITTSRRTRVRVAVNPIDVGRMHTTEIVNYVGSLLREPAFHHIGDLRRAEIERIGEAWGGVPLAIRWALSRCSSSSEAITSADRVLALGRHGDELLEFSFRRVFDTLLPPERAVIEVLSTLQSALPLEAIIAGCNANTIEIMDAIDDLAQDALIERRFDPQRNDFCFTVMPLTRSFVQRDLARTPEASSRIQRRLGDWFDAREVADEQLRVVVRELRRAGQADDSALVDLAVSAARRGDFDRAEDLFNQAMTRNPRSWRAARLRGEYYRHSKKDQVSALRCYRTAVANAPARGSDRALIMREYALLVRDSGEQDAHTAAEDALEKCLSETPRDQIALASYASLLAKRGAYRKVIDLLEPHELIPGSKFSSIAGPVLLNAYDQTNEMAKAVSLRRKLDPDSR